MFGLNEITWKTFLLWMTAILVLWYLVLFSVAWIKSRAGKTNLHFENETAWPESDTPLQPISVSAGQFPEDIIPLVQGEDVPLEVTPYETSGLDEGIGLDFFLEDTGEELPQWMEHIQYQQ
ncbi:MAG: hypothetical protein LC658_12445 [Bacteroidales bacterium]|nr:hypothetical protein [Bacteroidales bacterium]